MKSQDEFIKDVHEKVKQIELDYSRDSLLDQLGNSRIRDSYFMPHEISPQERYSFVSAAFGSDLAHSKRLYEYSSKHWFGYATPELSFGRNKRGMPISCFSVLIPDTSSGLVDSLSEANWLSILGGGVGLYFDIRSADEKSAGIIPHLKTYDAASLAYKQGTTRRGSYAVYMDVSNPEIVEFLSMRKVSGGDPNRKCLNIHNAVNLSDSFMEIVERCMLDPSASDDWNLIDPISKKVIDTVSAKDIWQDILELRSGAGRGEPYIMFIDNVNNAAPDAYKKRGMKVKQSNICSEIVNFTDKDNSFVCCLASHNLEYWDEYKDDYQYFKDVAEMLDNVMQYFINYAPKEVQRTINAAINERNIGIGAMGFHSYLQSKHVPFECALAKSINNNIFKTIRKHCDQANIELGAERGSPSILEGSGLRFTHMIALAPTASNSLICGNTSPSIEPWRANAFRQDTLSGSYTQKNKWLDKFFREHCPKNLAGDDKDIWVSDQWQDVVNAEGSIKDIKWMSQDDKDVFKTASEIEQLWVIEHAADRQRYIDQSQSLNIFIKPDISIPKLHAIHFSAWKKGIKTMYYCRSDKLYNTSVSKKVEKQRLDDDIKLMREIAAGEECLACHG